MSSPPPANNPSPLTIGRTFLKQYYHVLTTTPDMIYKFYRPSSVLSHGEGSNPSDPATLESLGDADDDNTSKALKGRFFSWSSGSPVRFELEHGAIDAQESVNGGVLLVVTGHLYLGETRKSFCHTFFLNVTPDSKKRQYYVHNDILRFLKEETPVVKESALSAVQEEEGLEEAAVTEDEEQHIQEETVQDEKEQEAPTDVEESPAVVVVEEKTVEVVDVVEPEIVDEPVVEVLVEERVEGVEETKEEPIYQAGVEETKEDVVEPIAENGTDQVKEAKPKPPAGSWASLVARSGSTAAPTPVLSKPTAKQSTKQSTKQPEKKKEQQPPVKKHEKKDEGNQAQGSEQKPKSQKRDPDCTLVIKGVPDGTKETDVRLIFETFATQTNAKILGITVSQRGLAFVDYDAAAPVLMALAQTEKFSLNGKTVDIDQKTNDNKNRGNRGNANRTNGRSGRAGNNHHNNNTSQNHRNSGSRGGGGGGGGRNGKTGK